MTRVSGGSASLMVPGLEQLAPLALSDFLMDTHEVTNREYKRFVDAGGCRDPACWEHPFVLDGEELTFDELKIRFLDFVLRSGRVLVYPVYKGTYERCSELSSDVQDISKLYRDHVIAWSRDLGRTINYLQTREDIDSAILRKHWHQCCR